MSTIWVTGGKGFIGQNLAQYINGQGLEVFGIGYGARAVNTSLFTAWLDSEIDFAGLNRLKEISGFPDTIYHLAGGASVGLSLNNPYEDFQRTVHSTIRLLEWVREVSPKTKIIAASSAAVYGAGFEGKIKENEKKGTPFSPYGHHKFMMENLFQSYRDSYGLNLFLVRLFSIYGAGLEKQLLWDLCNKLNNSDGNIELGGTGEEQRDWLHVSDAARLLFLMGNIENQSTNIVNGGTGFGTSIRQIADITTAVWGGSHELSFNGVARDGDPKNLVADISLIASLGFSPQVSLERGIQGVVEWFKARK